jgi:hypothetical protein
MKNWNICLFFGISLAFAACDKPTVTEELTLVSPIAYQEVSGGPQAFRWTSGSNDTCRIVVGSAGFATILLDIRLVTDNVTIDADFTPGAAYDWRVEQSGVVRGGNFRMQNVPALFAGLHAGQLTSIAYVQGQPTQYDTLAANVELGYDSTGVFELLVSGGLGRKMYFDALQSNHPRYVYRDNLQVTDSEYELELDVAADSLYFSRSELALGGQWFWRFAGPR